MRERPRVLKTSTDAPAGPGRPMRGGFYAVLGLLGIARRLDEAGVIRSPFGFALLALVQGRARSLKAGEYEVPQGSNTFAVLNLLEGGKVLKNTVLLREGSTLAELAHAVEAEGLGTAADILRVGHDPL